MSLFGWLRVDVPLKGMVVGIELILFLHNCKATLPTMNLFLRMINPEG
jgi:hypothetical protein